MRRPRHLVLNGCYHVTCRTNRKENIFLFPHSKEIFSEVMSLAKKKFRFRLHNFCIMGNHFHFLIQPDAKESLSRIMQWILSVFAMRFNRRYGLTGHVWGERFFSKVIESFKGFLKVFEYINLNPVKAGLVTDSSKWIGSAFFHAIKAIMVIINPVHFWYFYLFLGERKKLTN